MYNFKFFVDVDCKGIFNYSMDNLQSLNSVFSNLNLNIPSEGSLLEDGVEISDPKTEDKKSQVVTNVLSDNNPISKEDGASKLLMSELNLALGLPFEQRIVGKDNPSRPHSTVVKISDEKTNNILKIETRSLERSALSARAYDVLNVLMHFASKQLQSRSDESLVNFKIYYSTREICEELGLNPATYQGKINAAIRELGSMRLSISGHVFNLETKELKNPKTEFSLIQKTVGESRSVKNGKFASVKYVIFDTFIMELLNKGFEVNMDNYLNLKPGKERRAHNFIFAKRNLFGDIFSFDSDELSSVVGDSAKRPDNKMANVTKVLKNIQKKIPYMKFCIEKKYGEGKSIILIEFTEKSTNQTLFETETYGDFAKYYGVNKLREINFAERDYMQLQLSLSKKIINSLGQDVYSFFGESLVASDFFIDLALYQVIVTKYDKIRLNKLSQVIFESYLAEGVVQFPDGYNKHLKERIKEEEEKRQQEKISRQIRLREEEKEKEKLREDRNFKEFFKAHVETNEAFHSAYEEVARKELEKDGAFQESQNGLESSMASIIYDQSLKAKLYSVAKEDYYSFGKIFNKFTYHRSTEVGSKAVSDYMSQNKLLN